MLIGIDASRAVKGQKTGTEHYSEQIIYGIDCLLCHSAKHVKIKRASIKRPCNGGGLRGMRKYHTYVNFYNKVESKTISFRVVVTLQMKKTVFR